jgi:hypothetical protein
MPVPTPEPGPDQEQSPGPTPSPDAPDQIREGWGGPGWAWVEGSADTGPLPRCDGPGCRGPGRRAQARTEGVAAAEPSPLLVPEPALAGCGRRRPG